MLNVITNLYLFVYMLYRNNMINLNNIDRFKIALDNEMASQDRVIFNEFINGVEIDPQNLNINSLVKYITVIQKYKDDEEKKRYMETQPDSFENGQIIGTCSLDYILNVNNSFTLEEGEVACVLRFDITHNNIMLFVVNIAQESESKNVRYFVITKVFGNIYPRDLIIRMYDIRRNLIQESEVHVPDRGTIADVDLNENTYISYIQDNETDDEKPEKLVTYRNFDVELKFFTVKFVCTVMEDIYEKELMFDEFYVAGSGGVNVNPGENEVVIAIRLNEVDSIWQCGLTMRNGSSHKINEGSIYCMKRENIDDYYREFINNRENTVVDFSFYNRDEYLWYKQDEVEKESSGANAVIYRVYLGNNVNVNVTNN